jgi:hypothetical protein
MGSRDPEKPTAEVFAEVAEQTRLADELGYAIAWFAEVIPTTSNPPALSGASASEDDSGGNPGETEFFPSIKRRIGSFAALSAGHRWEKFRPVAAPAAWVGSNAFFRVPTPTQSLKTR